MRKLTVFTWTAAVLLMMVGVARAAMLHNTDNVSYEVVLTEPGYRQAYRSPFYILEHAQVEICFYGCEMAMRSTQQVVTVNADDTVIISYGVMRVERSWRNRP
jgi:hypothetical protein